jgi:hypothetical protein
MNMTILFFYAFALLMSASEHAVNTKYLLTQPLVTEIKITKRNNGIEVQQEDNLMLKKRDDKFANVPYIYGFGWFQAMWTVVDLMLGQFILTPVSGASISWARTIPAGTLKNTSPICTSFVAFAKSLEGFRATGIVVRGGGVSSYYANSIQCTDSTIVGWMIDHFSAISSGTISRSKWFSCGGFFWEIGKCGGPSIAVTRAAKAPTCNWSVKDATLIIRPCVDGKYWGGAFGYAVSGRYTWTFSVTVFHNTGPPTNRPTGTGTTVMPKTLPRNSLIISSRDNVDISTDFNTVDRDGDATLNYHEIAFAIADTNKDNRLSLAEYKAARAKRILVDTSYKHKKSISVDAALIADFEIIDRNVDGYLNYDEVAYAIADTSKDGKLSYDEYKVARAYGILLDTSYTLK